MPLSSLLWVLLASTFPGSCVAQKVTQEQSDIIRQVGQSVIFDCQYGIGWFTLYYSIYWYKQLPRGQMTLLIHQHSEHGNAAIGRYFINFQKEYQSISLTISALQLEDSAKYFCSLRELSSTRTKRDLGWPLKPDWREYGGVRKGGFHATDKLTFGKGTRLIVEPKSQSAASPSVFVMKNGTNVACLVKEFYPKDVTISLQSSKKIIEYEPAIVVSPEGKYSAVKLGQYSDPDSVTCSVEHNKKTWHSSDFEPKKDISETTPKPTESQNTTEIQVSATCYEPQVQPGKVNMMSLSVLGLRMLFAKSVAVNFLFTAKLFFF